jgi:hypothetical protein
MMDLSAQRVARRNRTAASFKDMRVFVDSRGSKLILDFRGSTGQSKMGIAGIGTAFKAFKGEVEDAESGPLSSGGDTIDEAVESYKDIGFLITRSYDIDDIRVTLEDHWDNLYEDDDRPEGSTAHILDEVADWLSGWFRVTRK